MEKKPGSRFHDDVPVGAAFAEPIQHAPRCPPEVSDKLKQMAEADFKINGCHMNAPYKVRHEGILYKGRVRPKHVVTSYIVEVEAQDNINRSRDVRGHVDLNC